MFKDRISKATKGRFFPMELKEIKHCLRAHSYNTSYAKECLNVFLDNCEVETVYGYQLCSFFRNRYFSSFSLPESVALGIARIALSMAIEKLSVLDKSPYRTLNEQQFIVYRVYLGSLGKTTITEHVINGKRRAYLKFDNARMLSKSECGSKGEKVLSTFKIA